MRFSRAAHFYIQAAALLALTRHASAQDDGFDCRFSYGDLQYDLTPLAGEHRIMRERKSPPTTMRDVVKFNLCADLDIEDGTDARDQCPAGTRACLITINEKDDEDDRTVAVIPLATSSSAAVHVQRRAVADGEFALAPKGIILTFQGPTYPDSSDDSWAQTFNLRLTCSTESSGLTFSDYDGSDMWAEWSAPSGCGFGAAPPDSGSDKPNDDAEEGDGSSGSHMGSGLGYFFLLLLLAFVAYFGLGAYYNYSTYGATGLDLIPHRDFWREVPYMFKDVVSHLCSAVRPRHTNRGGYIAV
ncbi:autophagy-related protein 27 [Fomitopsis serialis]|uniref:autophagy-related protein 27 n=1 Tax=Fomitopsis serialis TaxID=139415 RepID=UPI0020077435|nr:autophagy-related protein 27 [Neoantrodia serialis]KAH9935643.1 autophagy-related protein 27 [Neoantrodia serialis]